MIGADQGPVRTGEKNAPVVELLHLVNFLFIFLFEKSKIWTYL